MNAFCASSALLATKIELCYISFSVVLMKFWIRIWKTNPLDGRKRNINARKMKR